MAAGALSAASGMQIRILPTCSSFALVGLIWQGGRGEEGGGEGEAHTVQWRGSG